MRFVITGGGTGGHIYPALAIADRLKEEFSNTEILYVGTKNGLERDVVPRKGYPIEFVHAEGLSRQKSYKNIVTLLKTMQGVVQSMAIIARFKPDAVIGTGGYVAGPVMLAAVLLRKPTLIHEQNAFPGVTNRLLSKYVDQIALSFEEAEKYFKGKTMTHTGNPIRREILTYSREEGLQCLGLAPGKKTIFAVGGSGGATSLNQAMLDFYPYIAAHPDFQLVHVTGKRDYDHQMAAIQERKLELGPRIRVEKYLYHIEQAYAVADLVIGRSGAITLAELTARGIPAVLIPFPHSTDNHQEHNARALEKAGAARVILDQELTGTTLTGMVDEIFSSKGVLEKMKQASLMMGRPDADQRIIQIVREIIKK